MLSNETVKIWENAAAQRHLPFTEHVHMICVHKAAESYYLSSHMQKMSSKIMHNWCTLFLPGKSGQNILMTNMHYFIFHLPPV